MQIYAVNGYIGLITFYTVDAEHDVKLGLYWPIAIPISCSSATCYRLCRPIAVSIADTLGSILRLQ
jgi:hypothetical protein